MAVSGTSPVDYSWDVFLSYKRDPPVGPWVLSFFYRLFTGWLQDQVKAECTRLGIPQLPPPRVFLDVVTIPGGAFFGPTLQKALASSRVLAPICSPSYFESGWCTSEWQHFAARETALGRQDLIVPLCHNNRGALPPYVQARQIIDFSDLIPSAADLYNPNAVEFSFHNRVGQFAAQVARAVCSAPPYMDWPVVSLSDPAPRPTSLHGLAA